MVMGSPIKRVHTVLYYFFTYKHLKTLWESELGSANSSETEKGGERGNASRTHLEMRDICGILVYLGGKARSLRENGLEQMEEGTEGKRTDKKNNANFWCQGGPRDF